MMPIQRLSHSAVSCLPVILSLSATSAWAQTSQVGTVAGQVTDEQNAAVPGARVKLTDILTNAAQQTTTNTDGLAPIFRVKRAG